VLLSGKGRSIRLTQLCKKRSVMRRRLFTGRRRQTLIFDHGVDVVVGGLTGEELEVA
jgi:hypothetical protein